MKKNYCPQIEELILYRLNLLNSEEHRWIEEHLKTCQKCQREIKIEDEIEKELAIRLDPGAIETKVLRTLRFYKNCKGIRRDVSLLSLIFNSIFIVALSFCTSIVIEILWNEILLPFKSILSNTWLISTSSISILFYLLCLFFGLRRIILKVVE
jgi:hypothetical protein